ncbi:hypothetical protein HDV01_003616 [Terramyces sp. JEL0728]|nr:hypothetical protein HDV01_003616 [Terramyces sp. JEL0728]
MKKITDFFRRAPRESTPVLPENKKPEKIDFKENDVQVISIKTPKINRIEKRPITPTSKKTSSKFVKVKKQKVIVIDDDSSVEIPSKIPKTDSTHLNKIPLSEQKSKLPKPILSKRTPTASRLMQKYTPPDIELLGVQKRNPEFVSLIPKESPVKKTDTLKEGFDPKEITTGIIKMRKLRSHIQRNTDLQDKQVNQSTPSKIAKRIKKKSEILEENVGQNKADKAQLIAEQMTATNPSHLDTQSPSKVKVQITTSQKAFVPVEPNVPTVENTNIEIPETGPNHSEFAVEDFNSIASEGIDGNQCEMDKESKNQSSGAPVIEKSPVKISQIFTAIIEKKSSPVKESPCSPLKTTSPIKITQILSNKPNSPTEQLCVKSGSPQKINTADRSLLGFPDIDLGPIIPPVIRDSSDEDFLPKHLVETRPKHILSVSDSIIFEDDDMLPKPALVLSNSSDDEDFIPAKLKTKKRSTIAMAEDNPKRPKLIDEILNTPAQSKSTRPTRNTPRIDNRRDSSLDELVNLQKLLKTASNFKQKTGKYVELENKISSTPQSIRKNNLEDLSNKFNIDHRILEEGSKKHFAQHIRIVSPHNEIKIDFTKWSKDEKLESCNDANIDDFFAAELFSYWLGNGWNPPPGFLPNLSRVISSKESTMFISEIGSVINHIAMKCTFEDIQELLLIAGVSPLIVLNEYDLSDYVTKVEEHLDKKESKSRAKSPTFHILKFLEPVLKKQTLKTKEIVRLLDIFTLLLLDDSIQRCHSTVVNCLSLLVDSVDSSNWRDIEETWIKNMISRFISKDTVFKSNLHRLLKTFQLDFRGSRLMNVAELFAYHILLSWQRKEVEYTKDISIEEAVNTLQQLKLFSKDTPSYEETFEALLIFRCILSKSRILQQKANAKQVAKSLRVFHNKIDDRMGMYLDRSLVKDELLRLETVIKLIINP